MANVIKIKRSTTAATPTSLAEGELAYSENSNNLFIGTSGGNITTIGGAEGIADVVGTMVTGNTETGIQVTYDDADNTLDFALTAAPTITLGGDLSGTATLTNLTDATLTATIGTDAVQMAMVNTDVITGQTALAANPDGDNDYVLIYDASAASYKKIAAKYLGSNSLAELDNVGTDTATAGHLMLADGDSWESTAMSGDITISSAGVASIGSDKVLAAELGVTAGTATASRALVVDSNKDINLGSGDLTATNLTGTLTGDVTGNVVGNVTGDLTGNADTTTALATARTVGMTGDIVWTSGSFDGTGNVTGTAAIQANTVAAVELGVTAGAATASKALVVDANKDINLGTGDVTATNFIGSIQTASQGAITTVGTLTGLTVGGDATIADGSNDFDIASHDGTNGLKLGGVLVTTTSAELNVLDGSTAGTAVASKALVVDANKDINLGSGDITATNVTGTLQTATQTNVTSVGTLDGLAVSGSQTVTMGSNRITNVADPSQAQDAATKSYVDAVKTGLDVKDSVRVATTAAGTLATSFANGSTVDGVTLATGDRILLKNQATASDNGIYTVAASGAPTRATDYDADAEVSGGSFCFVEEGTTNADSGWVVSTNGDITVGSTSIDYAQFSGAGQITAGSGMTKTGNTLDVVGGNGITANANSMQIDTTWAGQAAITTVGTIASGAWQGDTIAAEHGGSGISSYSSGDMMYATGATTISKLSKGTGGQFLKMNTGATAPTWSNELDGGTF
jgi:hypothetical protein